MPPTGPPDHDTRLAAALTATVSLALVPAVYAILRAWSVLVTGEAAPLSVGPSAHIAMFWRVNLGVYVGLAAAPLIYRSFRADPELAVRWSGRALCASGALISLQGTLLP